MKRKVTKKYAQYIVGKGIIPIGYCHAQFLLHGRKPMWYTSSKTYGWRADVYNLGEGLAISTGYAPFGDIKLSYDFVKEYETAAFEAIAKHDEAEHERIFQAFVKAVRNGEGRV
nr:MAG TPA: hypothetical protein [Caudoviricetes sp.]